MSLGTGTLGTALPGVGTSSSAAVGTPEIAPEFVASAEALFGPALAARTSPTFIGSAEALFGPALAARTSPTFIGSAEAMFTPNVPSQNLAGQLTFTVAMTGRLTSVWGAAAPPDTLYETPLLQLNVVMPAPENVRDGQPYGAAL